jgi:hypothetical protein
VIISADWSYYYNLSPEHFFELFFATVKSLVDSGKFVLILAKAPEITGFEWDCVEKSHASASAAECPFVAAPKRYIQEANAKLKAYAEQTRNVGYFDVSPYICKNGLCSAFDADGYPLYYDFGHLSVSASWKIGERILHKEGIPPPFARIAERLQRPRAGN